MSPTILSPGREALLALSGRLAQFALMFASVRLMTSILPPHELGRLTLVSTATALFALLLVNPVGMFFNRRLHAWYAADRLRPYFHLYCGYLVVVALLGSALTWGVQAAGWVAIGISPAWLVALVGGSLLFNTLLQTLVPSLNLMGRVPSFVVLTLASLACGLSFSVWFTQAWGGTAEHWLVGAVGAQVVFSIVAYAVFFKYQPNVPVTFPDRAAIGRLVDYGVPLMLAVGLNWGYMQGYRFVLAEYVGLAELGLFAAGYGLAAALMAAMETVLTTWFQPAFYRQTHDAETSRRVQAWNTYAAVMLPASILGGAALIAASTWLPALMLGPDYQTAGRFIAWGALAEWARVVNGILSLHAHQEMRTQKLLVPSFLAVLVTYALLGLFLPILGLDGVAGAVAAGGLVGAAWLYIRSPDRSGSMRIAWQPIGASVAISAGLLVLASSLEPWVRQAGAAAPVAGVMVIALLWAWPAWRWVLRRHGRNEGT